MSDSQTPIYDALRPKERAFVDAYIAHRFNATAAIRSLKLKDARKAGHRLVTNGNIREAINERLREGRASADMVRARLEEQAFASMGDLLRFSTVEVDGKKKTIASLDLNKARRLGCLHLLSKIKERSWFDKEKEAVVKEIEVENYSAQTALLHLGKGYGLFECQDAPSGQPGVIRGPLRGQLSEEDRSNAANELEPTV